MNWHNWISMGGYGAYVWTAYGITLLAFTVNLVTTLAEKKHVRELIQQALSHES